MIRLALVSLGQYWRAKGMTFLRCEYFDRKAFSCRTGIYGNGIACEERPRVVASDGTVLESEIESEVYALDREAVSRCRVEVSTLRDKRYGLYCEWIVRQ